MASNQEAESIEKTLETTLEKTDFGHIINENKRPIIIVGAIILILIVAYSIMDTVQTNKRSEKLDSIFKVEDSVFNAYIDKKTDDATFKKAFLAISNEFIAEPNLVPPMLESLNKLETNKALDEEVLAKVGLWLGKMDKKNHLYLLTALRVAALYENHNQADKAIVLFEELVANKVEFMLDRIHFELGRLLKNKGDTVKAKAELQIVIDQFKDSEYVSLAKIYLSEMK